MTPAIRRFRWADQLARGSEGAKKGGLRKETPLALPVDVPGTVSGGEEPLSFTLTPPTCTLETRRGPFLWWDRTLHLAGNLWPLTSFRNSHKNPPRLLNVPFEMGTIHEVPSLEAGIAPPLLMMIDSGVILRQGVRDIRMKIFRLHIQ